MKKEVFVSIMNDLEKSYNELDEFDSWLTSDRMNCIWRAYELNVKILMEIFDDITDVFSWFMYETRFGKEIPDSQDELFVNIRNAGDLYDYLIKNQENQED